MFKCAVFKWGSMGSLLRKNFVFKDLCYIKVGSFRFPFKRELLWRFGAGFSQWLNICSCQVFGFIYYDVFLIYFDVATYKMYIIDFMHNSSQQKHIQYLNWFYTKIEHKSTIKRSNPNEMESISGTIINYCF